MVVVVGQSLVNSIATRAGQVVVGGDECIMKRVRARKKLRQLGPKWLQTISKQSCTYESFLAWDAVAKVVASDEVVI